MNNEVGVNTCAFAHLSTLILPLLQTKNRLPVTFRLSRPKQEIPLREPVSAEVDLIPQPTDVRSNVVSRLKVITQQPEVKSWRQSIGLDQENFQDAISAFQKQLEASLSEKNSAGSFKHLRSLASDRGRQSWPLLDQWLKANLHTQLLHQRYKQPAWALEGLVDLRYPVEWYPQARLLQRQIHLHVGPTNSGKTYQALKRLEEAETGVYAGPLRLLAHEVYTRLNAKGKTCDLLTGDDVRQTEGTETPLVSCTIEMTPANKLFDVAVIDEIQMIGNEERGWAWTAAVLGVRARELHLCGEARVVPLIRQLATLMGDKLEIHEYERLSPLKLMGDSLKGDIKKLRKGDCVVSFSRLLIHSLRNDIERETGKKCAVVYGSLPPEIRATQAKLFNDPDSEYDILVASDAIGMGLNL